MAFYSIYLAFIIFRIQIHPMQPLPGQTQTYINQPPQQTYTQQHIYTNQIQPSYRATQTTTSTQQLLGVQQQSNIHRSSLREHIHNPNSDQLYTPLRDVITNPMIMQNHAPLTPIAAQSSFVSKDYRILTPEQAAQLERNTFIPDVNLIPTNHLQKIRGERFVAIDASERIIGQPITPQELQRIRSQGIKKSEVLYEAGNVNTTQQTTIVEGHTSTQNHTIIDGHTSIAVPPSRPPKYNSRPVEDLPPRQKESYVPPPFQSYGQNSTGDYKYNLFSVVDQPLNRCREFGFGGCGSCPGNEVIASRNRPLSLNAGNQGSC